mmetsp:Transcript_27368/g.78880  ORF Transcript_27368/g.78880 Transcript_27368/m.78880 type:complete len:82 (+) Transcript_27368:1135-1380(+)
MVAVGIQNRGEQGPTGNYSLYLQLNERSLMFEASYFVQSKRHHVCTPMVTQFDPSLKERDGIQGVRRGPIDQQSLHQLTAL